MSTVETKGGIGPLVGVARFDGALITAAESGTGAPIISYKQFCELGFYAKDE